LTELERPRSVRAIYLGLGWICLGLGAVGTVLPVLPTTPFLLLAAACWARSSRRFHDWLVGHRTFGPTVRTWQRHRALPPGVKGPAIALVVLTIGLSVVFGLQAWLHRLMLGLLGAGLVAFLARLPVRSPDEA
jgi:uncharacterized membrane protein YbaN (DUF454 family)